MKKITMVALPLHGTASIRGIGSNRNREFRVGTPCDGAFGGGKITSITEDLTRQAIVISKGFPFSGPIDGNGGREVFDEVCVSFANTAYWAVSNEKPAEKPEDPPPAKPVQSAQHQNQGQQNQQRR